MIFDKQTLYKYQYYKKGKTKEFNDLIWLFERGENRIFLLKHNISMSIFYPSCNLIRLSSKELDQELLDFLNSNQSQAILEIGEGFEYPWGSMGLLLTKDEYNFILEYNFLTKTWTIWMPYSPKENKNNIICNTSK